jgi:uncharacterized protein
MIIETQFTPLYGLIGGALIGLAAVILMLGNGRIMGLSGIFSNLLTVSFDQHFSWRLVLIIGMLIGTAWTALFIPELRVIDFATGPIMTAIGGVIVGVGVTLGAGCTSGHGICGMSRLSPRSFTATIIFMCVAVITVFVIRHILGGVA